MDCRLTFSLRCYRVMWCDDIPESENGSGMGGYLINDSCVSFFYYFYSDFMCGWVGDLGVGSHG